MTQTGDPVLLVEQRGPVRVVRLNRPHVLNALNTEMESALIKALDDAERDPSTGAIVLGGTGRAFSAGADLKERADVEAIDVDGVVADYRLHSAFVRLMEMETPVIAAVHGYCLGGAMQLAGLCDVTILGRSAKLGEPEVRFANPLLIPITPHLVGQKAARKLLYLGSMIDADEAVRLGIGSSVVEDVELLDRAVELGQEIASIPAGSVRTISRATRLAAGARGLERGALTNVEILALTLRTQQLDAHKVAVAAELGPPISSPSEAMGISTTGSIPRRPEGEVMTTPPSTPGDPEVVHLERRDSVAIITLDRPDVLNAMNRQLLREFDQAFQDALEDPRTRSIIIRGEGRAFSAGMDLKEPDLRPLPDDGQRTHLAALMARCMRIWDAEKPVIAAVHGHCLGHACDLAAAADFTLAAESAVFGVPEVKHLGGVSAMLYPYLMTQKATRAFLYLGRTIDATTAMAVGLVSDVVPDDSLLDAAVSLATALGEIPVSGLRQMKRAVNRAYEGMGLRETLSLNLESLALVLNAQSQAELEDRERLIREGGLKAFLQQRDDSPASDQPAGSR